MFDFGDTGAFLPLQQSAPYAAAVAACGARVRWLEGSVLAVERGRLRLISRVRYSTPSGVDRVEMAYARGLLTHYGDRLDFAAVHPTGPYGRLSRPAALAYLDELERRKQSTALITLCAGGGMGIATIIERV